jgi:hypothetical protein
MEIFKNKLNRFLFQNVSSSLLSYFRIAVGFAMLYVIRNSFHIYFINDLLFSKYFVTYDLFHWVKPIPIFWFNILFYLLYLSSFLFIIGYKYRINAIILFLGITYCFLIDKGHYNNHLYLYSLILLLMTLVEADKYFSIDSYIKKKKDPTFNTDILSWQIWIFRFQFFIVYFYGGLAKLHLDWFKGFPMKFWLNSLSSNFTGSAAKFFQSEFAPYFFSYSGIIFDLSIGFLLLSKRWRKWALIPLITFHVSNHFLWYIGSFPWVMIFTTPIFFSDTFFKSFFDSISSFLNSIFNKNFTPVTISKFNKPSANLKKTIIVFVSIWITLQCTIPFRRYLYDGHPSWTGQGHLFSWRMMLVDIMHGISIEFYIPSNNDRFQVGLENYLNYRQFKKLSRVPMNVIKFTNYLSDEFKSNNPGIEYDIKIIFLKSVNERTPKLVLDSTINYANYPYKPFQSQKCFTEWSESNEEPTFNLKKYENWKSVVEKTAY